MTHRVGTIYTVVCIGAAVRIKSAAASWLHRVRQRANIHRYFVLTWLYEQSAGAQIVCPCKPIKLHSVKFYSNNHSFANYVYERTTCVCVCVCIRAHFKKEATLLARYEYVVVIPLLWFDRTLRALAFLPVLLRIAPHKQSKYFSLIYCRKLLEQWHKDITAATHIRY